MPRGGSHLAGPASSVAVTTVTITIITNSSLISRYASDPRAPRRARNG